MSQMKVFLSHSSHDKAFADALARAFRQAGVDVWYDEESLGAGHLRRTIMKELAERPVFVVLLSKAALVSGWVLDECEWAYDLQRSDPSRIMLRVVVAPLDWADLNVALYLQSLKRVEAGDLHPLPMADAATQALRLLGLTPAGQAPTPATPQSSESADDLVTRGRALLAQQQYSEAILFFDAATRLAPDNARAWANLGYAHNKLEQWQEGLTATERALGIRTNEAIVWNNKGWALAGLKRYHDALAAFDRALALDPQNVTVWANKAGALTVLKRYEAALAALHRALDLDPQNALAWSNQGTALTFLNRHEDALAAYAHALALNPKYASVWKNQAMCLRALGREAEAQEAERRARELGG